jgi:hypothetical protein
VIIFDDRHLRRVLSSYFQYYHKSRTHLSLDKDCPEPRPIHPPTAGNIIAFPRSVVCIIAINCALRELGRPIENARFGMDDRILFQLRHSTAAAISAHAYRIGAEDNLL